MSPASAAPAPPGKAGDLPPLPSERPNKPDRDIPQWDPDVAPPPPAGTPERAAARGPGFDPGRSTVSSRTATSTTYDNPDGSHTVEIHAAPVNFRDRRSGQWRPFDDTLVSDGDNGLRQLAGPVPVRLADETGADLVTIGDEDWSIGFRLEGAAPGRRARIAEGKSARYDDVADGVSLEYHTEGDRLKEQVILARPPKGKTPVVFRFPLTLEGVTPEARDDGSIVFVHDGEVVATVPPGFATDSGDDPRPVAGRVTNTLVRTGSRWRIDVAPEVEWLRDPSRVYPVFVDPTIFLGRQSPGPVYASSDAFVGDGCLDCNYNGNPGDALHPGQIENNAYVDKIGKSVYNGGNWEFYSYLYYDIAPIVNHQIVSGWWEGFFYEAGSYPSGSFALWPVSQSWNADTVTWRNKPDHRAENVLGHMPSAGWQWITRDVTSWVANWANGSWPYHGISVDTMGGNHWLKMAAVEQRWLNQDSVLNVTFTNVPATPGALTAPADGATVMTTTPTLSADASTDPEGDPLTYWFRIATTPDGQGHMVNSGPVGSTSWTPPADTLRDGQTYYWQVHTWDGWQWSQSAVRRFAVDFRLGDDAVSPQDAAGPVGVNLANGNVHFAVSSPTFDTVGGPLGLSYAYNSSASPANGLEGNYVRDCTDPDVDWWNRSSVRTTRRDPNIDFNWGAGSPMAGIDADEFCVRWTGWITMPRANRYCFLATNDDGVRVWVNGTLVVDNWFDQANSTPSSGSVLNNCVDTTLDDQSWPIIVDHYENTGGAFVSLQVNGGATGTVPASWLSTTPQVLPQGWTLSAGATAQLAYASAKVNPNGVTLTDTAGGTHEYRRNADGADGSVSFSPPPGEDDVVTMGQDGTYGSVVTVAGSDGIVYTFTATGKLVRAESGADGAAGTAPTYGYNTSTGRLDSVRDPVSQRSITLSYSPGPYSGVTNPCPSGPSGFQAVPPPGMLCRVDYWDGTSTSLYYLNDRLARIADPGGEVTDFGYDGNGRVNRVRDPLGADKAATDPGALDNDTTRTVVGYDGYGRATGVTLPVPNAGAAPAEPQPAHSYGYGWTPNDVYNSGGTTDVHVAGLGEPNGYARRAVFDSAGRVTQERDTAGLATTSTWNGDRLVGRTDPAGLRTTTVYDQAERAVESWGPAPSSCFGAAPTEPGWRGERPTSCTVAVSRTAYDEGIKGLAAVYWSNGTQTGKPSAWATGVGHPDGSLLADWGTGAPAGVSPTGDNWSARFTGEILFPTGGTYALKVCADDGTRLFVDDQRLVDDWGGGAACRGPYNVSAVSGERKRIRVDYRENGGAASISLLWTPPGGGEQVVPGADLSPRYGLVTSTTDADSKRVETQYAQPEYGLATATVQFPGGGLPALTTTAAYEPVGVGSYLRRTQRKLPKGDATAVTYSYYSGLEPAPLNDCGVAGVVQAGLLKRVTGADPEGADGPVVREYVHDARGRTAGSRVVGDSRWSCTSYDARGRLVSSTNRAGRTSSVAYSTSDPGLVTTTSPDSDGVSHATSGRVDLVGRDVSYTDELGTTTRRTYDQAGRGTEVWRRFSGGTDTRIVANVYNGVGRLDSSTEYLSGGARTTTYGYDAATGRPTTTTRPNGVTTTSGYNSSTGAVDSIAHGALSTWSYTRSAAGRIGSEAAAGSGTVPSRNRSFVYDGAGRLKSATEGATTRDYAWDADTNRCARAAACDGTYTFDGADRVTSSPDHSAYAYDGHGNMRTATPRTQPGPVPVTDAFSFDASSPVTPRTYPMTVGQSGTVDATLDWTNTGTVVTTGTNTGAIGAAPASTTVTAMTGPKTADTVLEAGLTWTKGIHRPTDTASLSVPAGGSQTRSVTTDATGDIVSTMDWGTTAKALTVSGSVANTTATTIGEGTITAGANGTVVLDLTWPSPSLPPPDLDLELLDHATGAVLESSTGTNLVTPSAHVETTVGGLGSYPSSRVYRWRVTAKAGSSSSFTLSGTYPVSATMDYRLENSSGTTVLATSTQVSGQRRRNLTYSSAPAGTYLLRALSSDHAAAPSLSTVSSRADWADVTLALKNGSTTLTSVRSSTGTLDGSRVVAQAASSGTFDWVVTNNSSDLNVPSFTLDRTTTSLGRDTASGTVAASGSASRTVVADAAGFADVVLTWTASTAGFADLTVALKQGSTTLASARSAGGSASFTSAVPAAGAYTVVVTNNSAAADVPSYSLTTRVPQKPPVTVDVALKNAAGTVVATATGARPRTLSASVTPGAYTLVVGPTAGKADATLAASYPTWPNRYDVTYDADDHAVRVDDGRTVVAETLTPSGRVLRRVVTEVGNPTPVEDTVFGYADGGDSPAYARPTAGGTVTTYLGDVVYTGTTAAWQLSNGHGDVVGTTDAAGAFTPHPVADEFGVGEVPGDRLGWLGAHDRFAVGGRLGLVRMGVRLYDSTLGRFLQVDPVEGGSANDYDYVSGDPVNNLDLDGRAQNRNPCLGGNYAKRHQKQCRGFWTGKFLNLSKATINTGKTIGKGVKGCVKGAPKGAVYGGAAGASVGHPAEGAIAGAVAGCAIGAASEILGPPGTPNPLTASGRPRRAQYE